MIFLGGIEDAANDVANFFKDDFAGGIADAAEDVGDWFADDFADFWTDDVGGAFEDFGNAIGGIFGKKYFFCDAFKSQFNDELCFYTQSLDISPTLRIAKINLMIL